ncbi:SDR family oxidoreductase [Alteribacillus bidgolensis]|uniref:Gluconate 5-dehydrogenase n=1 Tax=Alteribacillus bidgolensis TaxID=930129 RepID=A0A1G8G3D0_9BACI|nr:SDR family oxidoreductase [Alteribacillus bidgolensis]SDH88943.1 gluconate 5-dehydrogenase [Alteribacillus bidgolensis]
MSIIQQLFNLENKTAIVTGGGRGLGRQMALAYADAGANVVICSRKVQACEEVAEEITKKGTKGLALPFDVTDQEQVHRTVKETIDEFGAVDILVNNSGASWGASTLEMPIDAWHKVMNVNVTGTFLMTKAAGKHMVDQKSGKIINIASIAGLKGVDPKIMDAIGYNASKGAIVTFTKDLAAKWGASNVNVNAIAPGFFPTKMSKGVLEMGGDAIIECTPLQRLGGDEDLMGAALFLASKASDYVTGEILAVDGGMNAV